MKDFPVFTTSNGAASLILREVPYNHIAYIRLQDSQAPQALLEECVDFCVAVGAERVYATGDAVLGKYPQYARIVRMGCSKENVHQTDAALFPVLEETIEQWREIYNDKMKSVPMASYMTAIDAKDLLREKKGYFVHRDGTLLGIGIMNGHNLEAMASVKQGAGADVLAALCSIAYDDEISLSVATENNKAVDLYRRFGFITQGVLDIWYQVR